MPPKNDMNQPLILTLQIDPSARDFYETLRQRYFPPERNIISAHLSLFHQLPDEERTFEVICERARSTKGFQLSVGVPRSIGRGVAVFFSSPALASMHDALCDAFRADLIPQDRQPFKPHVVIQNKVDPATARETLSQVSGTSFIEPYAIGLTLWRYLGGQWEHLSDFPMIV